MSLYSLINTNSLNKMATTPFLYPAALTMWNILEAVAAYVDNTYSQLHPGLITIEKLEAATSDAGDDVSNWKLLYTIPLPLIEIYNVMQCEYYLLPAGAESNFMNFEAPKFPALTRKGWIKAQLVTYLHDLDCGETKTYDSLRKWIEKGDIRILSSGARLSPLQPKETIDYCANSLASELNIPINNIKANLTSYVASLSPSAAQASTETNITSSSFQQQQTALQQQARANELSRQRVALADAQIQASMERVNGMNNYGYQTRRRWF
ncbi:hypothetical protein BGZ60DRAFT_408042 [Tricladium varicosporioides]|nr:hypothetical protein BGZ60DRAFT_408042 [Hymenoscyphus varicosporioides]